MRRLLLQSLVLLAILVTPAYAQVYKTGDLVVSHAWSPATAKAGDGAGYITIDNNGPLDSLIGAACARAFGTTLTDETVTYKSGHGMEPMSTNLMPVLTEIPVPPKGHVVLKPGGIRLLLQQLLHPLVEGQTINCVLRFRHAGPVDIVLQVGRLGATSPPA